MTWYRSHIWRGREGAHPVRSSRDQFVQRLAAGIIVPVTFLPLAAILLAIGTQLGIAPVEAAGLAVIRSWLPLFYGIGISIGFADGEAMGALSVATGFLVMVSVAEAVSGDPSLNVGVLGGLIAGAVCTWIYNRVKHVELPEYLALFSGKRLGPQAAALAGIALGFLFGYFWPPIQGAINTLGQWIYSAGGAGAFVYGAALRLLLPTGLHQLLMQVVDTQMGGWLDPATGKMVAGEYLRFLAGDPQAGRLLSGFFVTLGFAAPGAALAMIQEARPEQRRRVAGLMTTGILTAAVLGITEPIEFAYIFASPVLFGLHVVLSGLASLLGWALDIHLGGYALPMILINWHRAQNGWLIFPLGLGYLALYYFSFRAVIRWLRPPILGQTDETPAADAAAPGPAGEGAAFLHALGGAANLDTLDACMTRLRVTARDQDRVDEAALRRLGAGAVLKGAAGTVQVVVGARAAVIADQIRAAMGGQPARAAITLVSPLSGRVIPLEEVPDPVFAGRLAGDGIALEPSEGCLLSPVKARVAHVFPGGHAIGLITDEGLELLLHVGIDTVALKGEGFTVAVVEGDQVKPGQELGRFDLGVLIAHGKSTVTPLLVTNMDQVERLTPLQSDRVTAGAPLLQVILRPR